VNTTNRSSSNPEPRETGGNGNKAAVGNLGPIEGPLSVSCRRTALLLLGVIACVFSACGGGPVADSNSNSNSAAYSDATRQDMGSAEVVPTETGFLRQQAEALLATAINAFGLGNDPTMSGEEPAECAHASDSAKPISCDLNIGPHREGAAAALDVDQRDSSEADAPAQEPATAASAITEVVSLEGSWVGDDVDQWTSAAISVLSAAGSQETLTWLAANPPNPVSVAIVRDAGRAICAGEEPADLSRLLVRPNGGIAAGLDHNVIQIVGGLLFVAQTIECPMTLLEGSAQDLDAVNNLRAHLGVEKVSAIDLEAWERGNLQSAIAVSSVVDFDRTALTWRPAAMNVLDFFGADAQKAAAWLESATPAESEAARAAAVTMCEQAIPAAEDARALGYAVGKEITAGSIMIPDALTDDDTVLLVVAIAAPECPQAWAEVVGLDLSTLLSLINS